MFTGISFAYFEGKRKEEGRLTTEDTESTEEERGRSNVGCIDPSTARPDAPNFGAKEKIGPLRSG